MRILLLATGLLCAVSAQAQDLLYAQRGNPSALLVNPAADVDARVWLAIPAVNATVQTSFAAGDVLGADLGTLWRQFPCESAGALTYDDIQLFSLGFKTKKSTYWLGSSLNVDASGLIDRDLVGFALWGMKDANGILDVRAKDRATGKEQQVRITASSMLDKSAVDQMVRDAAEHADEDRQRREDVETRNQAEALTFQAERAIKDLGDKVSARHVATYLDEHPELTTMPVQTIGPRPRLGGACTTTTSLSTTSMSTAGSKTIRGCSPRASRDQDTHRGKPE